MKTGRVAKYLFGTFVIFLFLILLESIVHPVQKFMDDIVYDNRNHYLSCTQLPTVAEVNRVISEHKEIIKQIEQVDAPNAIQVLVDDGTCSEFGTADILIMYPSHADRIKIQQIINADTFFGIPYRLLNM